MKKLLKHISPFAPDNSGAVGVLYELGGIIVICDAGGCAGNVCGFDEPRWQDRKSALFSAGLRDMDAILGRDDRLVQKLALAAKQIKADFTAVIGTPVPAVTATDYRALNRMSEGCTGLKSIALDTTGTAFYDLGEQKAYLELFKAFSHQKLPAVKGKVGVIGATPLNLSAVNSKRLVQSLKDWGCENPICFGMGAGLDEVRAVSGCEKILALSPAALKAAEYLKKKFGIEYEVGCPDIQNMEEKILRLLKRHTPKRILIVHQQFAANSLRERLEKSVDCEIVCGSWFMMDKAYMRQNDVRIDDEESFSRYAALGGFDLIAADKSLKRAAKGYNGEWADFVHFAVSGKMAESTEAV